MEIMYYTTSVLTKNRLTHTVIGSILKKYTTTQLFVYNARKYIVG